MPSLLRYELEIELVSGSYLSFSGGEISDATGFATRGSKRDTPRKRERDDGLDDRGRDPCEKRLNLGCCPVPRCAQ